MRHRWFAVVILVPLLLVSELQGQESVKFFPLAEVRPGMKGVGRTVFEGDKIEEFQVEILGVLKNVIAPKHDLILARLSGGPLEKAGVIAGMSGSPVYVDGRLVGAVALAFPFSKEPLTAITPIEEMLNVVPGASPPPATKTASLVDLRIARASTDPAGDGRLIPAEPGETTPWNKFLSPASEGSPVGALRLPLRFGGFSSQAIEAATPLFRQMGFEPMVGGVLSGSSAPGDATQPAEKPDLKPGSMISLFLLHGDLNINADCTVTHRQGDSLYACGHRILLAGPAEFPFAPARVLATIPSLLLSTKIDTPGEFVGSIRQDRFGAIYGVVGDKAQMISVRIHIDSTLNRKTDYSFEMVQETFLTPFLLNIGIVSTLASTERLMGPSTLEMKGKIRLSRGEEVDLEDVLSADMNTASLAGAAAATPLAYLLASGFPGLRVEGVDLSIVAANEKRTASLEQVWSSKSEVRPGDHIEVTAQLRTPSGEGVIEKIPVDIPESVTDKSLTLVLGSGPTLNALQNRLTPLTTAPRDLRQLVRALNRMRRNDRVYALLMAPQRSLVMQGDEYPSPPPSLVQTILADPSVSSGVTFSGTSVVGDFETMPRPYAIQGQKTIFLKVVGVGL